MELNGARYRAYTDEFIGIRCLPIFVKPNQFLLSDVISKRTSFSQPFLPPSDPRANAHWFFLRYRRYINHLLTYLLTSRHVILK